MAEVGQRGTAAKDFFLWLGAIIALYWSIIVFILLAFYCIDFVFAPRTGSVFLDLTGASYETASLIVLVPIYAILKWFIRRSIARDPSRKDIWVRRWAIIFTLFLTVILIAIDLVTVLTRFLNGTDFSLAFGLKVILIFLVAAGVFMHLIADLWNYWEKFPKKRLAVDIGTAIVIILLIAAEFLIVGTPHQMQLKRLDQQKISDLSQLQADILQYHNDTNTLPQNLTQLSNQGMAVPLFDPQTHESYIYQQTGKNSYQLCAVFNAPANIDASSATSVYGPIGVYGINYNWSHGTGETCFMRTVSTFIK